MGAHQMDTHFYKTTFAENLPVLLALIGIWNINFLSINNILVLTYTQDLQYFVPYLQQLDMESNGKSLDKQENTINYPTGPIVWGGSGNQAQHSYYQLLSQGTHKTAVDFISVDAFNNELINQVCEAQKTVLAFGVDSSDNPYNQISGNTPLNHIKIKDSTPQTMGSLIALFEHKIFVQGVIWNINSFDQPGVESSKRLLRTSMDESKMELIG
jgi:glucose-6-phosphate isomerase